VNSLGLFTALGAGTLSAGLIGGVLVSIFLSRPSPIKTPVVPEKFKRLRPGQWVLLLGAGVGLPLAAFADPFSGAIIIFLAVAVGYGLQKGPALRQRMDLKKKTLQLAEVFPQTLGMAIQALKTGQTMPQVLDYLSHECPPPLKGELVQICAEMDLGAPAEQALFRMQERYPNFSEWAQFVESYKISRQTGANLTHLLEVLLEGLEEKNRILRKMESATAQAKLSGWMMGLLPVILGTVIFCMDPSMMMPLFTEKAGWAILLLAVVLESIGFLWIRQLLQLEV